MLTTGKKILSYSQCPVPTLLGLIARKHFFEKKSSNKDFEINFLHQIKNLLSRDSHCDHKLPFYFLERCNVPVILAKPHDPRMVA